MWIKSDCNLIYHWTAGLQYPGYSTITLDIKHNWLYLVVCIGESSVAWREVESFSAWEEEESVWTVARECCDVVEFPGPEVASLSPQT